MSHGNWGKTPRSKNHFDHIKQVTRRTVLLATKTPIKSKSNKFLPKKTPMAPWEHREVQATKISFLGQKKCWVMKATENLKEDIDWKFDDLASRCFQKTCMFSTKVLICEAAKSIQMHVHCTHTNCKQPQIFNTIYYQPPAAPVPAPTATRTPTRTNKKSGSTTFPHRPSDKKSPLRSKRSRPNPCPGFLGIIGVEGGPFHVGLVLPEFMWMIAINIHDSWPGVWHSSIYSSCFFSRNPYPKFIMEMSNACYPSCTHPVAPVGTNIIIHKARLKEFSTHTPIQL